MIIQDGMENVLIQIDNKAEWSNYGYVMAKGYAIDSYGDYYSKGDLAKLFANVFAPEELVKLAQGLNGLFCILGNSSIGAYIITDRIRSIPMFYTANSKQFVISDNPYKLKDNPVFDNQSILEFKTSGYTLGGSTLYHDVFQVEAASIIYFKNNDISKIEYFNYTTTKSESKEYGEAKKELSEILDRCMQRMLKSVEGRTIAIPLSGGYDSRFILAWLEINGYKNVVTFTYGRKGNPDMILAERVASKLNTPWICIPYDDVVSQLSKDSSLEEYVLYVSNASSMPFFQDYPAIKSINYGRLIPQDSVIIPGHSGDFIAGSHLMPNDNKRTALQLINSSFNNNHNHYRVSKSEKRNIVEKTERFFDNYPKSNPYSIMEWWDFKERQAKFIVNSCRAYQFFGYDIRLPFFDDELVQFFRTLPFEFKLHKKIYNEVLQEVYFKPLGISFDDELNPTKFDIKKKNVSMYLKNTFPFLKNHTKQKDLVCYTEISSYLFNKYEFTPDPLFRKGLLNSSIIDWYLNFIRK